MITHSVHIYYSEHEISDVEHFEMTNYHKGMTAQKQGHLSIPSKKGWYIESHS